MLQMRQSSQITGAPVRLWVMLVCAFVAVAAFQGTRGIYETTEGRYAECAREMGERGNWLEPVLNGKHHWTKPPLTYIAIGVPCKVLGNTTFAARLYLIPCFLISIVAVWWLGLRMWGSRGAADVCAMVYATTGVPMAASNVISTDYLLAVSVFLAQAAFWEAFRAPAKRWPGYVLWLCMGVAFVTKGPPALLYLPAMVALWMRLPKGERRWTRLFPAGGVLLFLAVGLGWYCYEAAKHPGLLRYWFHDEVVERSLTDKFGRHPEFYHNFTIYLPMLLAGLLPWGFWLAARWRGAWGLLRFPGGVRRMFTGCSDAKLWMLWAVVFPMAVFCLSRSKLELYVLPLFASILAAVGYAVFTLYTGERGFRKWAVVTCVAAWAAFVVGKAALAHIPSRKDMKQLHAALVAVGARQPGQLTVFARERDLNGLSFYYGARLNRVDADQITAWAEGLTEPCFLLCNDNFEDALEERCLVLPKIPFSEYALSKWWWAFEILPGKQAEGKAFRLVRRWRGFEIVPDERHSDE